MDEYNSAIVFQGGGALGAYEYGVIKALYEARPGFKPAAVTGISIGAINAALLVGAKGDPLATLEEVWCKRFTRSLPAAARTLTGPFLTRHIEELLTYFGNGGMYQLRPDFLLAPALATSVYNLEPLRRTLGEFIDPVKLNQPDWIRLVVGAVNVLTGERTDFDNRDRELGIEHVIASGSIPPAFPVARVEGALYWDGGIIENTPLSTAINCLEQMPDDKRRELIVVELFPQEAPLPKNLSSVGNRLSQLIFESKLKIDHKLFNTINQTLDFIAKVEPHIPDELKSEPAYKEIFLKHKKIDALTVITAQLSPDKANATDFSEDTISYRIEAGYEDALSQHIESPHLIDHHRPRRRRHRASHSKSD